MVDHQVECLWSLISFLVHLFNAFSKAIRSTLERRRVSSHSDSSTSGTRLVSNLEEEEEKKKIVAEHGKSNVKRARKRPAMIVVPESPCCGPCGGLAGFAKAREAEEEKDMEVEGRGYGLASRKGKMHVMEDGYGVITDINGDSKQAFFGVFDGHGGRAAVDFVSAKLGQNIMGALAGGENKLEAATRLGYLTTDAEFLSQGVSSGACAATVLLNGRELLVGNAGDCRIVMSRNGEAITLTSDHTPGRDDEKIRIESSGGYVSCRNGRWRVQDSLAVSRAIGDANLKEWIISEPETRSLHLTPECEFLIMASDGLWHKVTDQEAVDVISKRHDLMKSCKDLVEMSCSRGNRDDVTVMVVDLQGFVQES